MISFTGLKKNTRLLIEAELKPLQSHRFQATGFPDLGPSRYQLADGTEMLLVESAQSVANRLEAVCWNEKTSDLVPELEGLPYIRVLAQTKNDVLLTSSILEAHRINSPYILEGEDRSIFDKLKQGTAHMEAAPIDFAELARLIFRYDAGAVLHGVFLVKISGRLRLARALTGFIEAVNVREVESGGVKNDRVNQSGEAKEGFGNVPFHRTEFTAGSVVAYFNLDLALLRGYGLAEEAVELLIALSLFKIRAFLNGGLRLRTACDLEVKENGLRVTSPAGFTMPDSVELTETIREKIRACAKGNLFASPAVSTVRWKPKAKAGTGSKVKTKSQESGAEDDEDAVSSAGDD